MGKTGGGRGTDGHQIKGRSAGSSHVLPEAEVTLPGPPPGAMVPPKITLTRNDIEALLGELDDEMTARGMTGTVELVGGAAMALAHYDRVGTTDVDGALHPSTEIIEVAEEIAERHGLRADWLNNRAQGFIPPGDTGDEPSVVRQGKSLTTMVVGAKTLLAMKLRAARPIKDVDDIAVLLRVCNITTLEQAQALMDEMYDGEHEISERGQRMVLGALGARSIDQASGEPLELDAVAPVRRSECGKLDLRTHQRCAQPLHHDGDCD